MENQTQNKVCQNCKGEFVIEPEDFNFYKRIQVPPPTFCPSCRLQRRLMWMKTIQLYKRKCNLCGNQGLSMYPSGSEYKIYCHDCWWGDGWDSLENGRDYDFNRPFFEQFEELFKSSPLRAQPIDSITRDLSPYTNHVGRSKNCYLIFFTDRCEDSAYGFFLKLVKNSYDCLAVWESENMYDVSNGFKSYNVFTGEGNVINCLDSYFLKDCKNCTNCFGCVNLRNKKYCFFNEQLSKDEYEKRLIEIDLGSYQIYEATRKKVKEFWKSKLPRPLYDDFSINVTGNYVFNSKNSAECYDVGYAEDSKFLMLMKAGPIKSCYDYMDGWSSAENMYECVTVGEKTYDVHFSQDGGHGLHSSDYTILCFGGSNLLGCVGLRNKEYCIFNKQYSKEEYFVMHKKIIEHMKKTGEYGEFFPSSMAPHAYNDTLAQLFFPKDKDEVLEEGLNWITPDTKEYVITINHYDLPDNIKDVTEDITEEAIQCSTCVRGYKIIHQEFHFLKQHNLPLPRQCPFCRIENKIKRWVWQMTLNDRTCDKCGVIFRTHYTKKEASIVYCKECYQKEVY